MKKIHDYLNEYPVDSSFIRNSLCPTIEIPIYIINLMSNIARKNYITHMMKKLNMNYYMITVDAISSKVHSEIAKSKNKGVVGCFLSHMWCINDAIKKKYLNFIIFEDDVVFHKDFTKLLKGLNYTQYDMLQLGCSDFNLKDNLNNINFNKETQVVYSPCKLALGAFANLYNINFAKIIFYEKLFKFEEFDTKFDMYYEKYNIGICFPNLVIADLSTTNLEHDFSIFSCKKKHRHNSYISKCFVNFKYTDYYFVWIVFLEQCHSYLKTKNITALSYEDYLINIEDFSKLTNAIDIKDILLNNGLEYGDINEMISY